MATVLTQDEIDAGLEDLHADWSGTTKGLQRSIEFAGFLTAVEFIGRLAPRAEAMDHHPDVDLRWRRVDLSLATHSAGGVTAKDFELAAALDTIAAALPQHGS
jgi:4a-hydroxytetrahydrobiopterin dehydratase